MQTEIKEVIAAVFRVDRTLIAANASPDSIPAWDSLGHLQLIQALEQRFGVRFQLREIQTMDTLSNIEAILARKLATPSTLAPS
ncbi:MAG: acyl carrier protein [Planctomycetes bacterium]|nr:acyl carrier protein [Planctomycetota bacterium]